MSVNEPDELYTLRNLFWLGNFQQAINEANTLNRLNATLAAEKEDYVYRCYLALGQPSVLINEVKEKPNTATNLKALRAFASFVSDPTRKESVKTFIDGLLESEKSNPLLQLLAAILCLHEDNTKGAIAYLTSENNIEQSALLVQLYLRIDRSDLAAAKLKSMKAADEDGVLTILATAWTNLASGPSKATEASLAFEELIEKYGSSPTLLNGFAVSKMQLGKFEEAESHLLEALTKAPMDPNTVSNLITVSQHLNKSSQTERYLSQLRTATIDHALLTSTSVFDSAYDRISLSL